MRKFNMMRLIILTGFVLSVMPMPAHAYIDAGTGSMIIQLAIGGIAAGLVTIKVFWYRIKALFSGERPATGSDQGPTQDG
jgi:hypothetical protein